MKKNKNQTQSGGKQLHVRIDDELYRCLKDCSEALDMPVQECVTISIRKFLQKHLPKAKTTAGPYTFIDLFAGIGGLRLALEAAGAACVFSSEGDKFCQKTYFSNFGEQLEGEISQIPSGRVPEHDILAASLPVPAFGESADVKEAIARSPFGEVCRILRDKRPKAFILDSPKTLPSHRKGETLETIKKALEDLGYSLFCQTIDAANYVPQRKRRFVMVGFDGERYGTDVGFEFNLRKEPTETRLGDILESEVDDKYGLSDRIWKYYREKRRTGESGDRGLGLSPLDGHANALTPRYHKDGLDIIVARTGRNPRRLTPRECARLQGFPDSFKITVSDTQAYRQFANSAVLPMMEDVSRLVVGRLKSLDEERERDYEPEYYI